MLPLFLALLLAAALAFQLLAGDEADLPPMGPVGRGSDAQRAMPRLASATGGGAIIARSMFAPKATSSGGSGTASGSPLGGYAVVGSIQVGRIVHAVVQAPGNRTFYARPGNRTFYARPGSAIGDWRVARVSRSDVLLVRGGVRMTVRFGPGGPTISASPQAGIQEGKAQ